MKREQKVIIGIILLLIAGWFYWFQYRPEKKFDECMLWAKREYLATWDAACEIEGLEPNCNLPVSRSERYAEQLLSDENICIKSYK